MYIIIQWVWIPNSIFGAFCYGHEVVVGAAKTNTATDVSVENDVKEEIDETEWFHRTGRQGVHEGPLTGCCLSE
jgi:hypothetical protein